MTKSPILSIFITVAILFGLFGCSLFTGKTTPTAAPTAVPGNDSMSLNVAFTAEMMPFAQEMAKRFNANRTADQVKVQVTEMESTGMVDATNQPDPKVQVISPD